MLDQDRPLKEQLAEHGISEHDIGDARRRELRTADGRVLGSYTAWQACEQFDDIVAAARGAA